MTTQGTGAPAPAATPAPAAQPKSGGGLFGLSDKLAALNAEKDKIVAAVQATGDASNTTNKGELIVTATFPFVADTIVASDILYVEPGSDAVKNHRNYITCDKADTDETTTIKTLCRGERIVHDKTRIGKDFGAEDSINPEFDGEGGGINNGKLFKKHAHPVAGQCSPDCDVEGKPVVRHHDPSKQNADNTDGLFIHSGLDFAKPPLDKLKARRCTIENLKAVCKDKGREADNGRLEVIEGNHVDVTFDWVDATATDPEARKSPKCQLPKSAAIKHSRYQVFRKKHHLVTNGYDDKEVKEAGKKFLLDDDWVGEKDEGGNGVEGVDNDSRNTTYDKNLEKEKDERSVGTLEQVQRARQPPPAVRSNAQTQALAEAGNPSATHEERQRRAQEAHSRDVAATQAQNSAFQADQKAWTNRARVADRLAKDMTAIHGVIVEAISIAEFIAAWNVKPMEIRFEAQGCAGAQLVTVGVMPRATWAVNFAKLAEIQKTIRTLQQTWATIKNYISKVKGMNFRFSLFEDTPLPKESSESLTIVVMNDAKLSFAFEYRELERDAAEDGEIAGRKKNQVHRAWRFEAGVGTVAGVGLKYRFPIARFAPCLGELGVLLLRLADIEIAIEVTVDVGIGIEGEFGQDEYGKMYRKPLMLTPSAVFSIGLVFEAGEFAKATAKIVGSVELKFSPEADANGIYIQRHESPVKLEFTWRAEVNLWGWTVGTGDTYPILESSFPKDKTTVCTFS